MSHMAYLIEGKSHIEKENCLIDFHLLWRNRTGCIIKQIMIPGCKSSYLWQINTFTRGCVLHITQCLLQIVHHFYKMCYSVDFDANNSVMNCKKDALTTPAGPVHPQVLHLVVGMGSVSLSCCMCHTLSVFGTTLWEDMKPSRSASTVSTHEPVLAFKCGRTNDTNTSSHYIRTVKYDQVWCQVKMPRLSLFSNTWKTHDKDVTSLWPS